jgi:methylphosphotriester-DNA--protein-cysteine methyltransferase
MNDLLRDVGEALYGPRWQSDLARDLGVSDRTMRRWLARTDDLPPGVALDLLRLCEERAAQLDEVRERLIAST